MAAPEESYMSKNYILCLPFREAWKKNINFTKIVLIISNLLSLL